MHCLFIFRKTENPGTEPCPQPARQPQGSDRKSGRRAARPAPCPGQSSWRPGRLRRLRPAPAGIGRSCPRKGLPESACRGYDRDDFAELASSTARPACSSVPCACPMPIPVLLLALLLSLTMAPAAQAEVPAAQVMTLYRFNGPASTKFAQPPSV